MTEITGAEAAQEALPEVVTCTMAELESYARRLPSPRISDQLEKLGTSFGEVCSNESGKERYAAWRLLMRDWPERDVTSLWLHSWFCEIEVTEVDPTPAAPPTASPPSAPSTTASPATSTS
jgi:hypothetical protein